MVAAVAGRGGLGCNTNTPSLPALVGRVCVKLLACMYLVFFFLSLSFIDVLDGMVMAWHLRWGVALLGVFFFLGGGFPNTCWLASLGERGLAIRLGWAEQGRRVCSFFSARVLDTNY